MAWTAASFKEHNPEFASIADAVVTLALSDAVSELDSRLFGDTFDQAVRWQAAHNLSVSSFGKQARLDAKGGDGATTYSAKLAVLARKRCGGGWAMGQGTGGML